MSSKGYISKSTTAILALVFFIPPLYFFILWARLGWIDAEMDVDIKVGRFLGYFPHFLQSISRIHYISIVCCVMAIYLSAVAFKQHELYIRVGMMLIVLFSAFLLVFNIYQMI